MSSYPFAFYEHHSTHPILAGTVGKVKDALGGEECVCGMFLNFLKHLIQYMIASSLKSFRCLVFATHATIELD